MFHADFATFVANVEKKMRWTLRRYRLRHGIKQYLTKPYVLTNKEKKEAVGYWKKYTKHFSLLWHEFYTQKNGCFDVRFVPEDVQFTEIEDYFNNWRAAYGIDNKNYYSLYFPEVKQPQILFRRMRGLFHDAEYNIITKDEAINRSIDARKVIVKIAVESGKGEGVQVWEESDGVDALRRIIEETSGELVCQAFLVQSEKMKAINPSSVQIIRVMTLVEKSGRIIVLKAFFQFGRTSSKISQEILGGAQVSIDKNGRLKKYDWDVKYEKNEAHPCGLIYEGWEVPGYKEVCQTAIMLHKKMGDFRLISWDFALDEEETPVFIEMNINYGGINAHQLGSGPLYGEETDEVLAEVFAKKRNDKKRNK